MPILSTLRRGGATGFVLAVFALIFAILVPADDARAGGSVCFAASTPSESLDTLAGQPARWSCEPDAPRLSAERGVLRLEPTDGGKPARFFATRSSMFSAVTLAVVQNDRVVAERRYEARDLKGGAGGRMLVFPIPHAAAPMDFVLVAFDAPRTRGLYSDAKLHAEDPSHQPGRVRELLLAAMICGILVMPLAFNVAIYQVLRERFLVWHLAVSIGLLAQCLLISGVLGHFVVMSLNLFAQLVILSLGLSISAAAGFCAAFIEPDKLDPRLRKALYWGAGQTIVLSLVHTFFPDFLRSVQTPIYYASFVPLMILFVWAMVDAMRRKSRSVRFQMVAWAPFMLMGAIRIATMLNPGVPQQEALHIFYFAMVIESIATSLGVADRFMSIKRQRDRAVSHARSMTQLSERDALTGLYNRRVLEGHLKDLERQGFTGFAVIDLDNFKRVNDTHGHALGDSVLSVAASVIASDADAVAIRLGGEEFLLLLRGRHVSSRVERLREAIPVRIAREVAQLEMLVTASAGLVESGERSTLRLPFEELYQLADGLLYEAKHNGRNLLASRVLDMASPSDAPTRAVAQLAG